jgi:hypothetical protein
MGPLSRLAGSVIGFSTLPPPSRRIVMVDDPTTVPPTAYQTVPTPAPDEPLDDPWRGDLVSVHGGRANRPPPARRTDTETVRVMVACRRHGCASQMSQDAVDKSAHNWFTQS